MEPRPWKTRLALAWFGLSTLLLVWPLFHRLGNAVHPMVLGLPWSFFYVLAIVLANFGALVFLYVARWVDAEEPQIEPSGDGRPAEGSE